MRTEQLALLVPPAPSVPSGKTDRWYTPRSLWLEIQKEFRCDWDVTFDAESPWSQAMGHGWGIAEDSLSRSWTRPRRYGGNVPFSEPRLWVEHAWSQVLGWDGTEERLGGLVVLIVPAWTDRAWWRREVEPFRDMPAGRSRPVFDKKTLWQTTPPRPWATLECRFLPRLTFGYPGDPEGVNSGNAFVSCAVLVWRPA